MENLKMLVKTIEKDMPFFYQEDDFQTDHFYLSSLPNQEVHCEIKIKSELVVAGLPHFAACFHYLGANLEAFEKIIPYEGKKLNNGEVLTSRNFILPFNIALSAERVALNLLAHACSVATYTREVAKKCENSNISILDTRKTTPGLRGLEKYAVRVGGGKNHRFSQNDVWMVKDNHKKFFGGLVKAVEFFESLGSFYRPIVVEVHSLEELEAAMNLSSDRARHLLLDNFSIDQIYEAIKIKKKGFTYEISGGIHKENVESYLIEGVDAISMGALTHSAPSVDISFKYH